MSHRGIVARFNPRDPLLAPEFLCRRVARSGAGEWHWSERRGDAHVFEHYDDADEKARAMEYRDATGRAHQPWPLVLTADAGRRASVPAGRADGDIHMPARTTPQEAYAALERRHLD